MDIGKYRALLRTVEMGNITRAAEELGYTQSAVSRIIASGQQRHSPLLLQIGDDQRQDGRGPQLCRGGAAAPSKGSVQCGPGAPGGGGPTPRTHPGHHSGGDIQQYFGPLAAPAHENLSGAISGDPIRGHDPY